MVMTLTADFNDIITESASLTLSDEWRHEHVTSGRVSSERSLHNDDSHLQRIHSKAVDEAHIPDDADERRPVMT